MLSQTNFRVLRDAVRCVIVGAMFAGLCTTAYAQMSADMSPAPPPQSGDPHVKQIKAHCHSGERRIVTADDEGVQVDVFDIDPTDDQFLTVGNLIGPNMPGNVEVPGVKIAALPCFTYYCSEKLPGDAQQYVNDPTILGYKVDKSKTIRYEKHKPVDPRIRKKINCNIINAFSQSAQVTNQFGEQGARFRNGQSSEKGGQSPISVPRGCILRCTEAGDNLNSPRTAPVGQLSQTSQPPPGSAKSAAEALRSAIQGNGTANAVRNAAGNLVGTLLGDQQLLSALMARYPANAELKKELDRTEGALQRAAEIERALGQIADDKKEKPLQEALGAVKNAQLRLVAADLARDLANYTVKVEPTTGSGGVIVSNEPSGSSESLSRGSTFETGRPSAPQGMTGSWPLLSLSPEVVAYARFALSQLAHVVARVMPIPAISISPYAPFAVPAAMVARSW